MARRFTEQESTFIDVAARTGDRLIAAEKAGYAQPQRDAWRVMQKPDVQAEIARREVARLFNEALPAAVSCLISIMTNDKAPAGARVSAAKVTLDKTLGVDEAGKSKEPHEMTPDEIAQAIAALERVAADRAKPIVDDPGIFA